MNQEDTLALKEWLREVRIEKIERLLGPKTINLYFEEFEI
jgi:hypothetical protein